MLVLLSLEFLAYISYAARSEAFVETLRYTGRGRGELYEEQPNNGGTPSSGFCAGKKFEACPDMVDNQ